jgi:phage head maturation protease
MKHKALADVEVADKGEVSAIFSRFNVIDHDKDVTLPDAFTDGQPVKISAYGHESWKGALPVGRGAIRTTKSEAILFLNTTAGHDTFQVVKELGDLQEWSYGYDILKAEPGEFEGEKVQFLQKLSVPEVSPVLVGAGIGTQTVAVKALGGFTLDEWISATKADLDDSEKVRALLEHIKAGRVLSAKNEATLKNAYDAIGEVLKQLEEKPEEETKASLTQEPTRAIQAGPKHLTLLLELEALEAS